MSLKHYSVTKLMEKLDVVDVGIKILLKNYLAFFKRQNLKNNNN